MYHDIAVYFCRGRLRLGQGRKSLITGKHRAKIYRRKTRVEKYLQCVNEVAESLWWHNSAAENPV